MPAVERRDGVQKAQEALARAEEAIKAAERERDEADERLDVELARLGWTRQFGGFSGELYSHLTGPGHLVPRAQLLEALALERRNAA